MTDINIIFIAQPHKNRIKCYRWSNGKRISNLIYKCGGAYPTLSHLQSVHCNSWLKAKEIMGW